MFQTLTSDLILRICVFAQAILIIYLLLKIKTLFIYMQKTLKLLDQVVDAFSGRLNRIDSVLFDSKHGIKSQTHNPAGPSDS